MGVNGRKKTKRWKTYVQVKATEIDEWHFLCTQPLLSHYLTLSSLHLSFLRLFPLPPVCPSGESEKRWDGGRIIRMDHPVSEWRKWVNWDKWMERKWQWGNEGEWAVGKPFLSLPFLSCNSLLYPSLSWSVSWLVSRWPPKSHQWSEGKETRNLET